jgi:hypothetical protein
VAKTNWAEKFQKHSELGVDFSGKKPATFGSDFEHPMLMDDVPHPGAILPPTMNRHPDYDVFGGSFGQERAKGLRGATPSSFGIGTVIPSTYQPPPPPPPPPQTPEDAGGGGGVFGEDLVAKQPGWLKAILIGLGLFFIGKSIDSVAEKKLGNRKPIVLFHR